MSNILNRANIESSSGMLKRSNKENGENIKVFGEKFGLSQLMKLF